MKRTLSGSIRDTSTSSSTNLQFPPPPSSSSSVPTTTSHVQVVSFDPPPSLQPPSSSSTPKRSVSNNNTSRQQQQQQQKYYSSRDHHHQKNKKIKNESSSSFLPDCWTVLSLPTKAFVCFAILCMIVLLMTVLSAVHLDHRRLHKDDDLKVNGMKLFSAKSGMHHHHHDHRQHERHQHHQKDHEKRKEHEHEHKQRGNDEEKVANQSVAETTTTHPPAATLEAAPTLAPPIQQQQDQQQQEKAKEKEKETTKQRERPERPPRLISSRRLASMNHNEENSKNENAEDINQNNLTAFFDAHKKYKEFLKVDLSKEQNDHKNFHFHVNHPDHLQETKSYIDIEEFPGLGVPIPHRVHQHQNGGGAGGVLQTRIVFDGNDHNPKLVGDDEEKKKKEQQEEEDETLEQQWKACDPTDTDFTEQRDRLCSAYLRNWNNMKTVKAMSSKLYDGRTIKFKVFYRHGNITAIIKVSQHKFVYEPISEMLAFGVERALGFQKVPPTAWTPFPLNYLEAAAGLVNPLYAQWLNQFVVDFHFLDLFHFPCIPPLPADDPNVKNTILGQNVHELSPFAEVFGKDDDAGGLCVNVTIQLWMEDVHPALYTYLALNFEQDDFFYHYFFTPRQGRKWPPHHQHRRLALGDICDRFIFDFITGNTDRGMNDHNNFVYGGCDGHISSCGPPKEEWKRTKREAKYAYLDQGSSFYSHREPEGSPFTGKNRTICRFRKTTYEKLKSFVRSNQDIKDHYRPLVVESVKRVPGYDSAFKLVHASVFKTIQDRAEKIVRIADGCMESFSEEEVLVL